MGEDYGKQHHAQCDDPEGHDGKSFFRADRYVRTRDENIFKGTEDAGDMRGSPRFRQQGRQIHIAECTQSDGGFAKHHESRSKRRKTYKCVQLRTLLSVPRKESLLR